MSANRDVNVQQEWAGRSGNDYLQRGGQGYQSWGAEGPGGTAASGGLPTDAAPLPSAAGDESTGAATPADAARAGGSPVLTLLAGLGLGAALMYFLDPERGRGRRHRAAEQVASAARDAQKRLHDVAVHARNRGAGAVAEVRGRLTEEEVTDEQLVARVRAELGHHIENVRPIEVAAEGGNVTLRGDVPAQELPAVIAAVEKVRGVEWVDDRLEPRPDTAGEPTAEL